MMERMSEDSLCDLIRDHFGDLYALLTQWSEQITQRQAFQDGAGSRLQYISLPKPCDDSADNWGLLVDTVSARMVIAPEMYPPDDCEQPSKHHGLEFAQPDCVESPGAMKNYYTYGREPCSIKVPIEVGGWSSIAKIVDGTCANSVPPVVINRRHPTWHSKLPMPHIKKTTDSHYWSVIKISSQVVTGIG